MSLFAWFALAGSIICLCLAVNVLFFNRKNLLNRIFICAILFGAYTAFTGFMVLQAENAETAYLWNKIGFAWPFFIVLLLQFILVFTENPFAAKKIRYVLLYLPAAVFALLDLTTDQLAGFPVQGKWGYFLPESGSWLCSITNIWSITVSCASVLLCFTYYFNVRDKNKKNQARLITISLGYPILLNVLSWGAYVLFGWDIPHTGSGSNAILCLLIVYAIWKHGLFNLSPAIAAESLIATMPDSFILTDPESKILRANPALTGLLGYEESELSGKPVDQLLADEPIAVLLKDLSKKQAVKNHETILRTKWGNQKPVSVSASAITNKRGKNLGVTLIIHDLTRRKQNEEKLVKAERFATIGQLAGMIGHDLRNPLTSIQGATYYLKLKYAKDMNAPAREMLDTIERSIQYSNKIISDLLEYSKEIHLETEETNPRSLISNALALTPSPAHIKLVDLTSDVPILYVDTGKLSRVFVNIVKNAFDAMPNGGTLTIKSMESQGTVEICFEDTGEGMTTETVQKLWTPLFTTKAKGMGFGLPICKRIVEAHGGRIQVQSTLAEGTTFAIVLPLGRSSKTENQ